MLVRQSCQRGRELRVRLAPHGALLRWIFYRGRHALSEGNGRQRMTTLRGSSGGLSLVHDDLQQPRLEGAGKVEPLEGIERLDEGELRDLLRIVCAGDEPG